MITTLPGLYLFTVGVMKPVSSLLNIEAMTLCTPFWLRAINVFFAMGNFYLIYAILKKLHNPLLVILLFTLQPKYIYVCTKQITAFKKGKQTCFCRVIRCMIFVKNYLICRIHAPCIIIFVKPTSMYLTFIER